MIEPFYILIFLGLLLSIYALHVKNNIKNKSYKPLCDIAKNVSCTKAFGSKYGNLAVLPNPIYGILIYVLLGIFYFINKTDYVFYLSSFLMLVTIYLACISYIKQKNFCLVCTATYVINILLFLSTF